MRQAATLAELVRGKPREISAPTTTVLRYGQMELTVELITPEIAAKLIANPAPKQRPLKWDWVAQYTRDMQAGTWYDKPVAIALDEQGRTCNGNHTLHAIVKSGIAQLMLVARNVNLNSVAVMDRGFTRTMPDVARFLGVDWQDSRTASVTRIVAYGPHMDRRSFGEVYAAWELHQEALDKVFSVYTKKGRVVGINSVSLAVCVRATYTNEIAGISRFLQVVENGMSEGPHESAGIRYRDYARGGSRTSGKDGRIEAYGRCSSALDAFLRRRPLQLLRASREEVFPTPHDGRFV